MPMIIFSMLLRYLYIAMVPFPAQRTGVYRNIQLGEFHRAQVSSWEITYYLRSKHVTQDTPSSVCRWQMN